MTKQHLFTIAERVAEKIHTLNNGNVGVILIESLYGEPQLSIVKKQGYGEIITPDGWIFKKVDRSFAVITNEITDIRFVVVRRNVLNNMKTVKTLKRLFISPVPTK